jgi:hypothetical protein
MASLAADLTIITRGFVELFTATPKKGSTLIVRVLLRSSFIC